MAPAEFTAFVGNLCSTLDAGGNFVAAQRQQTALDEANVRNTRRNLNLSMIGLMEKGKGLNSPEVQAIRAKLAQLPQ